MAKLSSQQKKLLSRYGYDLKDVFDATGMRAKEWKAKLTELDKKFAIGVTACVKSGHSMRNRSGNCVECDPVILNYMSMYKTEGDVYVAWSLKGKIAKIGCAKDANSRLKSLIETCYGNQNDWNLELISECTDSGQVEKIAHKLLKEYKLSGVSYFHNGRQQTSSELFDCSLLQAKNALNKAVLEYLAIN